MTGRQRLRKLRGVLKEMRSVLVAFSGGADSTFLLAVAAATLKDRVLAVTVDVPALPRCEIRQAVFLARRLGVRHLVINGVVPKEFWENSPQRCYYCKKSIFRRLKQLARARGLDAVVDASHVDDIREYRPGVRALTELGIRSPLREAGLSKRQIRRLSRAAGLATWDTPAMACLATRIPYGEKITRCRLAMVEKAEAAVRRLGMVAPRVRAHGAVARIEVAPGEIPAAVRMRKGICAALRACGFVYAALDLQGYRSGSMHEELSWKKKR